MKITRTLFLIGILCSIFFGYQIVLFLGLEFGLAVIALLFMGGVALSLVLADTNSHQEKPWMEDIREH